MLNPTTAEKSRSVKANILGILREESRKTVDEPTSLQTACGNVNWHNPSGGHWVICFKGLTYVQKY